MRRKIKKTHIVLVALYKSNILMNTSCVSMIHGREKGGRGESTLYYEMVMVVCICRGGGCIVRWLWCSMAREREKRDPGYQSRQSPALER